MKQLRILTGRHAGAQLRLTQSRYGIARDDDADVQITDWNTPPLLLTLEEGQAVTLLALDAQAPDAAAAPLGTLEDFCPRRFGDVVLCVGPEDARWPSDMALLERLVHDSSAGQRAAAGGGARRTLLGMALAGAVLLLGGLVVVAKSGDAKAEAPPEPLVRQVERAVQAASVSGVQVRQAGRQVEIDGLLAGAADMARLRSALAPFAGQPLLQRYASASDIAQSITDALADPKLAISYRGAGVFLVDGHAADLPRVREAAQRIATDLAPLVRRIDVAAIELPAPERVPVGAMLAADDLQYVQTRDGVKHLSLKPLSLPEETPSDPADGGAATPRPPLTH